MNPSSIRVVSASLRTWLFACLVGALGRITTVEVRRPLPDVVGADRSRRGFANQFGRLGTAFSMFVLPGSSQDRRAAAATVATASSVHVPVTITTMCSMPRAAMSEHRRANASGDSPSVSRVLRVFSMSS